MKFAFVAVLVLASSAAMAQNVKDFNKALINDVEKDIAKDTDQYLKSNKEPMRGPASVDVDEAASDIEEDINIKPNDKKFGNQKW